MRNRSENLSFNTQVRTEYQEHLATRCKKMSNNNTHAPAGSSLFVLVLSGLVVLSYLFGARFDPLGSPRSDAGEKWIG